MFGPTPIRAITAGLAVVRSALVFVQTYSLNATDAVILRLALDRKALLATTGDRLVLAASDQRLVAAARSEGLDVFDPEVQSAADFDVLLGP